MCVDGILVSSYLVRPSKNYIRVTKSAKSKSSVIKFIIDQNPLNEVFVVPCNLKIKPASEVVEIFK